MEGSQVQIRAARTGDAGAVAGPAGELAQSFPFFYRALGYAESAAYLRKVLPSRAR